LAQKNEHGLTAGQERFAHLVASGKNQTDAYREAYPKSAKWSKEALRVAGAKMSANGNVTVRISKIQAAGAEIAGLEAAEILREVLRIATSDIGGIMDASGRVKLPNELDAATRRAIKSFKMDEFGRIEYQFWDKNAGLEKAMKHLGLYKEDNNQKPATVTRIELVALEDAPKDDDAHDD